MSLNVSCKGTKPNHWVLSRSSNVAPARLVCIVHLWQQDARSNLDFERLQLFDTLPGKSHELSPLGSKAIRIPKIPWGTSHWESAQASCCLPSDLKLGWTRYVKIWSKKDQKVPRRNKTRQIAILQNRQDLWAACMDTGCPGRYFPHYANESPSVARSATPSRNPKLRSKNVASRRLFNLYNMIRSVRICSLSTCSCSWSAHVLKQWTCQTLWNCQNLHASSYPVSMSPFFRHFFFSAMPAVKPMPRTKAPDLLRCPMQYNPW